MLKNGKSITMIGFYLRNLSAIINEIIALNKNIKIDYPFGNNKYVIPTKKNFKKALTNEDLKKTFNYQTESVESKYFHFGHFMYVGNGMNPYDMYNLKRLYNPIAFNISYLYIFPCLFLFYFIGFIISNQKYK